MLDIKFVCNNPEVVKQNIKNKFQEEKLPLVDQVIDLYQRSLKAKQESEALRANRNKLSKQIGMLMGQAKKDPSKQAEANAVKAQVLRPGRGDEAAHRRGRRPQPAGTLHPAEYPQHHRLLCAHRS